MDTCLVDFCALSVKGNFSCLGTYESNLRNKVSFMRSRWSLLVLLVFLIPSAASAAPTDPRDDKKRIDAELARVGALLEVASAQAQQAATRLAEINKALPVAAERAAVARGLVAAAEAEVLTSRAAADDARTRWDEATDRYARAADEVLLGRKRLGRFATVAHQGGEIAKFNALVESGSPRQLAVRIGYAMKVAEAKRDAIDDLVGAERRAKEVSNQATLAKREADAALADARAAVVQAEAAREEAELSQRELADLAGHQERAVAEAEAYRQEVLDKHEEVKRESERIAAELRAWEQSRSAASGPVLQPGARLLMPVSGWKSSDFGMRFDPYFHVWQLHAGVDIAAGGGQPIYAAADGWVASAGWRGGYGNYTCLSHGSYQGENLSTCYAHQSRILVSHGQRVTRGQIIGRVGTTGASTGNHLHFEVRLDGEPVEPEDWLPSCLC